MDEYKTDSSEAKDDRGAEGSLPDKALTPAVEEGGEDRPDEEEIEPPPATKREPSIPPPPIVPPEKEQTGSSDPNDGIEPSMGDEIHGDGDAEEPVRTGYVFVADPPPDDEADKTGTPHDGGAEETDERLLKWFLGFSPQDLKEEIGRLDQDLRELQKKRYLLLKALCTRTTTGYLAIAAYHAASRALAEAREKQLKLHVYSFTAVLPVSRAVYTCAAQLSFFAKDTGTVVRLECPSGLCVYVRPQTGQETVFSFPHNGVIREYHLRWFPDEVSAKAWVRRADECMRSQDSANPDEQTAAAEESEPDAVKDDAEELIFDDPASLAETVQK